MEMRGMEAAARKTALVIFGGCSTEYEVSLQSACAVLMHMDESLYEALPIGIDHNGQWFWYQGPVERIGEDRWLEERYLTPVMVSPDKRLHGILVLQDSADKNQENAKRSRQKGRETNGSGLVMAVKKPVDLAFPVLHGKNGEDGTVQGVLELAGIPVVGCCLLSSALCMDKELAHRLAAAKGIRVPKAAVFHALTACLPQEKARRRQEEGQFLQGQDPVAWQNDIWRVAQSLGFPLFVKPVRSGSSFGITKVMREKELIPAVFHALEHDDSVILEEFIEGFEVGCAVLGDRELILGDVDEIELSEGFFDYTEKYTLKTSAIHVPARISPQKTEEVKKAAVQIYRILKCSGFARVDLFLTPQGELVFNEVNTIPGMTAHSRYPGMMRSAGISFEELVRRLLASVGEAADSWEPASEGMKDGESRRPQKSR